MSLSSCPEIQLGRRFRALKLWFILRSYGVEGLQKIIRKHIQLAQMLKQLIKDDPRFSIMAPVEFGLLCFRLNPSNKSEQQIDDMNKQLLESVNKTGKTLLTHTKLKGKYVIRFCIGQRTTKKKHVIKIWNLITKETEKILNKNK